MDRPVGLGAVGLGRWARVLASAYVPSPLVKLHTCYSRDETNRERFAAAYDCSMSPSLDDLLSNDEVEAVIVTVPNDQHAPVIEEVVRAGKHVFVEKPIAVDLHHALRIAKAVEQAGVIFSCGHSARRLGGIRKMRELVESGEAGRVSMVEGVFTNERAMDIKPDDWRADPAKAPGGPLTQLGIHQIDNLHYLVGPVDAVSAFGGKAAPHVGNDTVVQAVMEFRSGVLGYLGTNWVAPGMFRLNLFGTARNLCYDLDFSWWSNSDVTDQHSTLTETVLEKPGSDPDKRVTSVSELTYAKTNHLRDEIEELASAVRGVGRPEVGAEEAVRNLVVLLAMVKAAREGRVVSIAEVASEHGVPEPWVTDGRPS